MKRRIDFDDFMGIAFGVLVLALLAAFVAAVWIQVLR